MSVPKTGPRSTRAASKHSRQREREVLDAAIAVFSEKSYAAASVADVADRVGMLKGSLYYYVESKEDLLMRIMRQAHGEATEIVATVGELDLSASERLEEFIRRYVRWQIANAPQVGLYFGEWRSLTGQRREEVREQRKIFERFVSGLIADIHDEQPHLRQTDPHLLVFYVLTAINSVWAWYRPHGKQSPATIAEGYAQLVLTTVATFPN
jgi:AcrR family transcriptional regulator